MEKNWRKRHAAEAIPEFQAKMMMGNELGSTAGWQNLHLTRTFAVKTMRELTGENWRVSKVHGEIAIRDKFPLFIRKQIESGSKDCFTVVYLWKHQGGNVPLRRSVKTKRKKNIRKILLDSHGEHAVAFCLDELKMHDSDKKKATDITNTMLDTYYRKMGAAWDQKHFLVISVFRCFRVLVCDGLQK